ncbi:MAG: hypothetical protein ACNYNX_01595 [Leucobacter sp.]
MFSSSVVLPEPGAPKTTTGIFAFIAASAWSRTETQAGLVPGSALASGTHSVAVCPPVTDSPALSWFSGASSTSMIAPIT